MSTATLKDLEVGDHVQVKRNLHHPVHMVRGPYNVHQGYRPYLVDPSPAAREPLGTATVTERRDIAGDHQWPEDTLVRLNNGFWYSCTTGLQSRAKATFIERI